MYISFQSATFTRGSELKTESAFHAYSLNSYPPVPSQPRMLTLSKMPMIISTPMRMITIHSSRAVWPVFWCSRIMFNKSWRTCASKAQALVMPAARCDARARRPSIHTHLSIPGALSAGPEMKSLLWWPKAGEKALHQTDPTRAYTSSTLPSRLEGKASRRSVGSPGPKVVPRPNKANGAHHLKNAHKHTDGHQNDDNPLQV